MDEVDPLMGSVLADTYIIDSLLGEGGMGRVYLARHTRIDAKRFAIKVLHEEFSRHQEALARFRREAEATALISNPYVVGVHDVGTTPDGRPFMASDYLVGEELADRLHREGQLPIGEAVRIVRQICLGVVAAHERGVIHRDIKPENVFLVGSAHQSTAKLLDFGISRLQNAGGKALTKAGVALGTPDYMSPEQANGNPIDHRADIYALGLLLYVALTGVSPFEREGGPQQSLIALLTEEAPPPSMFESQIPPQLEALIGRAMTKEPDGRFQSAHELWQVLAPFDPTSVTAAAPAAISASPSVGGAHDAASAGVHGAASAAHGAASGAAHGAASAAHGAASAGAHNAASGAAHGAASAGAYGAASAAHGAASGAAHGAASAGAYGPAQASSAAAAPGSATTAAAALPSTGAPGPSATSPQVSTAAGAASGAALPSTAELLAERQARKVVLITAGVGMAATLLALTLAVGGLLRALRVDLEIGGWLLVMVLAAVVVGGAAAVARVVVLGSWWRGAAVMRLQRITAITVGAGCAGYAFAALLIRLLQIALLDKPKGLGEPAYDILLLLAAVLSAAAGGALTALRDKS